MGMYDVLGNCDGQVKCFDVPCYYNEENQPHIVHIGYMGGLLRYFNEGDEVPVSTWWYHYPDDFLIIYLDWYCNDESCIHLIKDKKYLKTYYLYDELPVSLFETKSVFTSYGEKICGVSSKSALYEYIHDFLEHNQKIKDINYKYADTEKALLNKIRKNKDNTEIADQLQMVFRKRQAEILPVLFAFKEKWMAKEDPRVLVIRNFGAYLDAFKNVSEWSDEKKRDRNYYTNLINEFEWYQKDRDVSLEDFLEWYSGDPRPVTDIYREISKVKNDD